MTKKLQSQFSARTSFSAFAMPTLLMGAAFCFSGAVVAENQACSGTKAYYSLATAAVCLPAVAVVTPTGTQYYLAQMQWIDASNPPRFSLTGATPIPAPPTVGAVFTPATGLLTIPAIEQYDLFGVNRYAVSLQLVPNTAPAEFQLAPNISAVISPSYAPGVTWKPYVGLLPDEKAALNTLGYSLPFSPLNVAVYDFNVKSVGAWNLKETASTGSGMQAGVYVNSQTNQVALTFRGTEFCTDLFSCSYSQLKESAQDVLADSLLTQGRDSGQFNDAYLFAQQMVNTYSDKKIIVTGHSLGGGLAQAIGATFQLETYAFNSSPVPNNYFNDHLVKQINPVYDQLIHVLSDIHDPISNTDYSGRLYADAAHITPPIFFDFDKKEITPEYKTNLDALRFNKHAMTTLRDNIAALMLVFQNGW